MIFLAASFIVILAMQATSEIIAPLLLAFVLAVCLTPLLYWFQKKGLSNGLALILTIAVNVVLVVVLVLLVSASVNNFSESLADYEQRFTEIEQAISGITSNLGVDPEQVDSDADSVFAPSGLVQLAVTFAAEIVAGISNWGLIIMVVIFFLVEASGVRGKIESVTRMDDPDVRQLFGLTEGLREYMVINAGVGALAAVLNTILLFVLGIEGAILWGVLSFFLSFVPSIGFFISVIPPAIMALIQFGPTQMLIVIVLFIVINFLVDNVIKPKFIQEGVNVSATVTFISLIVWGWVLGPIGAILAVPMAIIIQASLASREETRWAAYMMGSGDEPYEHEVVPPEEGGSA
jgi:predicted PurR-regulated permease PerM